MKSTATLKEIIAMNPTAVQDVKTRDFFAFSELEFDEDGLETTFVRFCESNINEAGFQTTWMGENLDYKVFTKSNFENFKQFNGF